ncbi:MAG: molybdopterin molybdotransferase MoeA [Oscillospiraceae bacterium]|nr:molybdopterin molybdotransferase MoeA [Oscillospiraceae bacterium]
MINGIELEDAIALMAQHITPLGTEKVNLFQSLGRTLAYDITAPMPQPPFDRSPLDGYALRAEDIAGASKEHPVTLTVVDTIYAGDVPMIPVKEGQAVRIMTGSMLPPGCNCVLMQEETDMGNPDVAIYSSLKPYANYCYRGEDYRFGDLLIPAGARINAAAIGVLSSAGIVENIAVLRRPSIAVLSTGDEVVIPGTGVELPAGKIYGSNANMIAARLCELGFAEVRIEHAGDNADLVSSAIRQLAVKSEVVITTGGVSVGAKDILHDAIELLHAEKLFWHVKMKPGTPAIFSLYGNVPLLSLSGNPFAAAATFELLARPLLSAMTDEDWLYPRQIAGVVQTPFPKESRGRRFIRGRIANGKVFLPDEHSSGSLSSMVGCNCLVDLPAGTPPLVGGEQVNVWKL